MGKARNPRTIWSCAIALPERFRQGDVLAFHRRDALMVAESVAGSMLHKGLLWRGCPTRLTLRFDEGFAAVDLAMDGAPAAGDESALMLMARRMLGLMQDTEAFERAYREHPQVGSLIARNAGLRVPLAATPFEALSWAIIGQQISVSAAVSVRRKLIQTAGLPHSSGLWCYPDAGRIAATAETGLRQAGLSSMKAQTMLALSERVEQGLLPLDEWANAPPIEEIRAQLGKIRGIGPWTIDYALLRGFGWLDGSLHGDAAVRRNMQALLRRSEKITEGEARKWLAEFSPWRALVAAHLWAMQSAGGC